MVGSDVVKVVFKQCSFTPSENILVYSSSSLSLPLPLTNMFTDTELFVIPFLEKLLTECSLEKICMPSAFHFFSVTHVFLGFSCDFIQPKIQRLNIPFSLKV